MIFPLTSDNQVVMVKQYRHGVRQILLELPAGTYSKDKGNPEEAARRELQEETGYRAGNLIQLGKLYDYPTKDTHNITVFLATNITYNPIQHNENTESIERLKIPLQEIDKYIREGKITVAGTIAAIRLAQLYTIHQLTK